VLTVLEYAGSALIGIFYITILAAMATRKTSGPKATREVAAPTPEFDRAA
jgi:hypothetical protein